MKYLGVVQHAHIDKRGAPFARVLPICEVPSWRAVDRDEFPVDGFVFWPAAKDVSEGSLITFRCETNGTMRDKLKVADPNDVPEVLDLTKQGTAEQVRQALARSAIQLPEGRFVFACKDGHVGPHRLQRESGRLALATAKIDSIPWFAPGRVRPHTVSYGKVTRQVVLDLPPPDALLDWDEDKRVFRRALSSAVKRAKRVDPGAAIVAATQGSVSATTRLVDEAAESLVRLGDSQELRREASRYQRLGQHLKDFAVAADLASEFLEELRGLPEVKAAIADVIEGERALAREAAQEELRSERTMLDELRAESARVEATVVARGVQLQLLDVAHETKLRDLETTEAARAAEIEGAISQRVQDALARPSALLAESAVLRAFLGGSPAHTSPGRSEARTERRATFSWISVRPVDSAGVELKRAMIASAKAHGVPSTSWRPVHAAVLAGLAPLIVGPRALDIISAYADAVAGGRMFVVPATASLQEPGDLFGAIDRGSGGFVPHASRLIDLLPAAASFGGPVIVVIDGVNRAPTEGYLAPLLRSARRRLPLRLFVRESLRVGDPFEACSEISIPENVILMGTVAAGPTTLPLSADLWTEAVLLDSDEQDWPLRAEGRRDVTEVPLLASVRVTQTEEDPIDAELPRELAPYRSAAAGFGAALARIKVDAAELRATVMKGLLIPALLAGGAGADDVTALAKALSVDLDVSPGFVARTHRRVT